ncbi:TPA: hypothetical protein ACHTFF_003661 [Clostridioides difficile]|uniref:Uncharacterized protein n=1 Tax=Clostridioides difficile TaxID=1496 RepID=A0A069ALU7_CLODI|nr:hypothetical protein [Clostridioides difficile]EQI69869.1 hypothetical protein QQA_0032 [Clostridioides difficile Y343]EQJ95811.1 hypothetical protein QUC_0069 [Clostridioides difficile P50]EQK55692.1 hypothetical protein C674_0031 [Clostridioides difficile F480]EQK59250.1 hypothetical protein C675_0033 [Clostridioides difficile F525]ERM30927.1 hypothetical protein QSW_0041 [Clostridioides difficile P41]
MYLLKKDKGTFNSSGIFISTSIFEFRVENGSGSAILQIIKISFYEFDKKYNTILNELNVK